MSGSYEAVLLDNSVFLIFPNHENNTHSVKEKACIVWFFIVPPEERLYPLTFAFILSLVTYCDIPWKPIFLLSLWGLCLASLCQIAAPPAIWLHHRLELGGGRAGNIISRHWEREWGDKSLELFCLYVCAHGPLPCLKPEGPVACCCPYFISSSPCLISLLTARLRVSTVSTTLSCLRLQWRLPVEYMYGVCA